MRPVVGVCVAVDAARFGPWNQDVALVPTRLIIAMHENGWQALLLTLDADLATEPDEVLRLLDGLIVADWAARGDGYGEFARRLAEGAEARGLPVLRLGERPDAEVAGYRRAIGELFTGALTER